MNDAFYRAVLQHPAMSRSSAIFDDQDNIIWIDWREEEEAIVDYVRDRIGAEDLTATISESDNDWGYAVTISLRNESRIICPELKLDSRHATLIALDELLSGDFQIRFVSDTTGSDTIGVTVERVGDWDMLYKKYGRRLNEHFCPIRELPDLMNTPADEIDQACANYATRIG
jgi:hypothetical protein